MYYPTVSPQWYNAMENLNIFSVCARHLQPPVLLFLTEPCYAHVSFGTLAAFDVANEDHPDEDDRAEDAWGDEDWEDDDGEDWDDEEEYDANDEEEYEEETDDDGIAYADWDDEDEWSFGILRNTITKTPRRFRDGEGRSEKQKPNRRRPTHRTWTPDRFESDDDYDDL